MIPTQAQTRPRLRINRFSLVELVVAMAVMLVVAMIIGTASTMFYNGYRRSVRHADRLKEYMAIDRIWDTAVRNMIPFQWRDGDDAARFVFEGTPDSMLFVTPRRVYGDDPGALMFIKVRLDESDLVAEYSFFPRTQWDEDNDGELETTREVLAANVKSISFQYAELSEDEAGSYDWLENWEEDEHASIPMAVRLTVEWNDGSKEYWLRRVAGVSATSTLGTRQTVASGESGLSEGGVYSGTRDSTTTTTTTSSSASARLNEAGE